MDGNLSDLLQKTISSDELDLIHRVADEALGLGFSIYIVGGFVRDLILGHSTLDFDLVVEGDAIKLADFLLQNMAEKQRFTRNLERQNGVLINIPSLT